MSIGVPVCTAPMRLPRPPEVTKTSACSRTATWGTHGYTSMLGGTVPRVAVSKPLPTVMTARQGRPVSARTQVRKNSDCSWAKVPMEITTRGVSSCGVSQVAVRSSARKHGPTKAVSSPKVSSAVWNARGA